MPLFFHALAVAGAWPWLGVTGDGGAIFASVVHAQTLLRYVAPFANYVGKRVMSYVLATTRATRHADNTQRRCKAT